MPSIGEPPRDAEQEDKRRPLRSAGQTKLSLAAIGGPGERGADREHEQNCRPGAAQRVAVTLDRARAAAGFPLRELEEEPDRVYLGKRGTVWFLYGSPQRIRLLVAQTPRAEIDEEYIVKKLATAGTVVDRLEVDGVPALLLSGEPHVVALVDESGELIQESTRLAQNVLLWEEDDVAIRLEGAFSRDEALELAAALR